MTNPYPEKIPDEASGIEIEKPTHKAYQRGYEDGLNDGLERERQRREYKIEAVADRAIDKEMQLREMELRDARAGGQADLVKKFNEWADEMKIDLNAIPPINGLHAERLDARVDMLQSAKDNLARLAKEKNNASN